MSIQDFTINGNTKVQFALIGVIITLVVTGTTKIVSMSNTIDVHERRMTASELQIDQNKEAQAKQREQDREEFFAFQSDVKTFMTRIETKLDISLGNSIVK